MDVIWRAETDGLQMKSSVLMRISNVDIRRDLWRSCTPAPLVNESRTQGCWFWISPEMEVQSPLWTTCSGAWSPLLAFVSFVIFSLIFPLNPRWLENRVCLGHLYFCTSVFPDIDKMSPPELSFLLLRPNSPSPQPVCVGYALPYLTSLKSFSKHALVCYW